MPSPPPSVTDFQRAIVENFQDGRLSELAQIDDQKKLVAALRKDPSAGLLAFLVERTAGLDDAGEVGAQLITAEIDVKAAMAAVGAVATMRHGPGR